MSRTRRIRALWCRRAQALLAVLCCASPIAAAAPADLVVEAEIAPAEVYLGGEARLTLRLYRAPGATHGVLRPPALGEAADLALLGPIRITEIERAGVLYEVIERTHVLVPRRAGRLILPGAEFEGALRYAEVFGPNAERTRPARRSVRGPQLALQVRAPPAGAAEPWLPARRLTLEESWSRDLDALPTGTPVTRTLILRAEGLAAERLPRLEMAAHPAFLVHHDQPEFHTEYLAEGMIGRRVQRIVLMPVGAAEVALPALRVRWWDVVEDVAREAALAPRTLRLQAALAPVAMPGAARGIASAPPVFLRWSLVAIVALTGFALWWHLRTRARRSALRALRAACLHNDPQAARDALLDWSRAQGAGALLVQRIGASWPDAGARAQVRALDAALYAQRPWDGAAFWRSVRPQLRGVPRRRAGSAATLPPLHRLRARET